MSRLDNLCIRIIVGMSLSNKLFDMLKKKLSKSRDVVWLILPTRQWGGREDIVFIQLWFDWLQNQDHDLDISVRNFS